MRRRDDSFLPLLILSAVTVTLGVVALMAGSDLGILLIIIGAFTASITAAKRLSRGFR